MQRFGLWEIDDSGKIQHLHPGLEHIGYLIDFRRQKVCSYCNQSMPRSVAKLATKVSQKRGNMSETKKKTTISKKDVQKAAAAQQGADDSNMPRYEAYEGAILRFPDGKPSDEVRTLLKKNGFTFRQSPQKEWVGPLSGLQNTPFKIEE